MLIHQFICQEDNIAILLHDELTRTTIAIDAPDGAAIAAQLQQKNWPLDGVLITHHHQDHICGLATLKQQFGAKIWAPAVEKAKIVGADHYIDDGDQAAIGPFKFNVIATPGHTIGSVCYHLRDEACLFSGDSLFAMGCGRLFEASSDVMFDSLQKLAALDDDTAIYCGHEYARANGAFARYVEPDNETVAARYQYLLSLPNGAISQPTTLALEKATNPFLRAAIIGPKLGMEGQDARQIFKKLRLMKDAF